MKRATRFASYELRTDGITLLLPLDGPVLIQDDLR